MPIFFSKSRPLNVAKAAFQYIYDDQGDTYVDCACNVQHVGHSHPRIVQQGLQQLSSFNANTRFLNSHIVDYAQNLKRTCFSQGKLGVSVFVNSGSEANDLAIYIARLITNREDVIVMDQNYHGNTRVCHEISVMKFKGKAGLGQKDYIHVCPMPDEYRGLYSYQDPQAGEQYAYHVKEIIENLKKKGRKLAAFICESIPANGGLSLLPKNYLKKVYQYVREAGGVCIADEVQVGFGRVEGKWWGYELQEAEPDMVVIGKPMGNGHPVAGVVMTQEIAQRYDRDQVYFSSFGGNPISMKIANEVLNTIVDEKLRENADIVGRYLLQELKILQKKHKIIGSVRGSGLFLGVEFVKDRRNKVPYVGIAEKISNSLKMEKKFVILEDGQYSNILKMKPPLCFSIDNATALVRALDEILEKDYYIQWKNE